MSHQSLLTFAIEPKPKKRKTDQPEEVGDDEEPEREDDAEVEGAELEDDEEEEEAGADNDEVRCSESSTHPTHSSQTP